MQPQLDGLDGGLIADALARGSERVVVDSVLLSLTLSDALLADEQAAFLAGLRAGRQLFRRCRKRKHSRQPV